MTKNKITAAVGLWAFLMIILIVAIWIFPELVNQALDIESFFKGLAVPLVFAVMSLIAVEKGDRHARKN